MTSSAQVCRQLIEAEARVDYAAMFGATALTEAVLNQQRRSRRLAENGAKECIV